MSKPTRRTSPVNAPQTAITITGLVPASAMRRIPEDHPAFAALQVERADTAANWDVVAQYAKWVAQLADKVAAGLNATGSLDDESAIHAIHLLEAAADYLPALRGMGGDSYAVQPVDAAAAFALRTLPRD